MREATPIPRARREGLVVKALGDEVLVYDLERHRAHNLNRAAAAVWRACDGTRTVDQIATWLRAEASVPLAEEAVRYAVAELGRARLIAGRPRETGLTRRELMRRLGTAAVAVPVVTSVVAPTVAQAQSCSGYFGPCGTSLDCCAGLICTTLNRCEGE